MVVGAFSSPSRITGESSIHFPLASFKKKKKITAEISSRTLIPLFRSRSVHSGSASCDDYDRVFPDELRVSLFRDRFLHNAWIAA